MTQEEKAKAYDEALERASEFYNNEECRIGITPINLEVIFPELKEESEDEKTKKEIIKYIEGTFPNEFSGIESKNKWIAWLEKQGQEPIKVSIWKHWKDGVCGNGEGKLIYLIKDGGDYSLSSSLGYECDYILLSDLDNLMIEKQGEKKCFLNPSNDKDIRSFVQEIERLAKAYDLNLPNRSYDIYAFAKDLLDYLEKQGEQKLSDKIEPKFHEGEWITNGDYTWKIIEVKPLDYILQSQDGNIVDDTISHVDEQFHSFTIKDAKDGDVLVCESGWTCIFKTLVNDETFSSYCFMDKTKWFCDTDSGCHTLDEIFVKAYNGKISPATKEQRDTLFAKMKEAGYKWDAENKELKKIEHKSVCSDDKKLTDVNHEYFNELLENNNSKDINDYAYQVAYCMSHDWANETPTWDDVQKACKLGAEWKGKHRKFKWNEQENKDKLKSLLFNTKSITYESFKNEDDPLVAIYFNNLIEIIDKL